MGTPCRSFRSARAGPIQTNYNLVNVNEEENGNKNRNREAKEGKRTKDKERQKNLCIKETRDFMESKKMLF